MANENRYYRFPFAESGNRAEVPDVSVSGSVGYDTGYGPDYELPQGNAARKRIEKNFFNGALYSITKNLKQWQENNHPTWIEDNGTGSAFSYSKGVVVHHSGENWVSMIDSNQTEPEAGVNWSIFDPSLLSIDNIPWISKPLGQAFPIRTDLGAPEPPTDNPSFRFIKLSYNDAYNAGALTGEVLSGTAPAVLASGVISVAGSPMNGETVRLVNSMASFIRPHTVGGTVLGDTIRNIEGSLIIGANHRESLASPTGAFYGIGTEAVTSSNPGGGPTGPASLGFDASRDVATSIENRPYSESAVFYMRVL